MLSVSVIYLHSSVLKSTDIFHLISASENKTLNLVTECRNEMPDAACLTGWDSAWAASRRNRYIIMVKKNKSCLRMPLRSKKAQDHNFTFFFNCTYCAFCTYSSSLYVVLSLVLNSTQPLTWVHGLEFTAVSNPNESILGHRCRVQHFGHHGIFNAPTMLKNAADK